MSNPKTSKTRRKSTVPLSRPVRARIQALEDFFQLLADARVNLDGVAAELLFGEYITNKHAWPEKLAVADFVRGQCSNNPKAFIIDTGSSAAACALMLMSGNSLPSTIITNSITTASFIGATKAQRHSEVPVTYVPGGKVESEYLGTWDALPANALIELYPKQIESLNPNSCVADGRHTVAILAASFFTATTGIGANSEWNKNWKLFASKVATQIFVCIDANKMDRLSADGIHTRNEWMELLNNKQVCVVVAGTPTRRNEHVFQTQLEELRHIEAVLHRALIYHGTRATGSWIFTSAIFNEQIKLTW